MQYETNRPIKKAVFPVAGLGTRFLPATKATPKEMLPIIDKPIIQYAVEEAIDAGCSELIFITSANKRAIEDHFDTSNELEQHLLKKQETEALESIRAILPQHVSFVFTRQKAPLGLGHAISCAKNIVGHEPFAVILADDLISAPNYCLTQMVSEYEEHKGSILAVEKIPLEKSICYGVAKTKAVNSNIGIIEEIIEKPKPDEAPSNLGVVGRYILEPEIFTILDSLKPGRNGEIQLTDGISELLQSKTCYAYEFIGDRFDCGNKLGYLEAIIEFGLKRKDIEEPLKSFLKTKLSNKKAFAFSH